MFRVSDKNTEDVEKYDVSSTGGTFKGDSLVTSNAPPVFGYCSSSQFMRYGDTKYYQWWAKTSHAWTPYGAVLEKGE